MKGYGVNVVKWGNVPGSHAIVATVSHKEYLGMGLNKLKEKLMPKGVFVDVKSSFDPQELVESGYTTWRL